MTTSQYFNHTNNPQEQDLYDSLVQESIQITGYDVLYIRRDEFDIDPVLYEPKASKYKTAFTIEANIPQNLMGWEGDTSMVQFGFSVNNTGQILFSKTRWDNIQNERKKNKQTYIDQPQEGDLIYFGYGKHKYNHTLFVIDKVDFSDMNWQLGKNFTYRCTCSLYTPTSNETVAIPNFNIDKEVQNRLDKEEVIRQNENIEAISKSLSVFDEKNPFGGF